MTKELFRSITNLDPLRRKILESSKTVIQNLKSYQSLLDIRKEKKELMKMLRIQVEEINVLMESLKDKFPSEAVSSYKPKASQSKKSKKTPKNIVAPSELTKLERKLSDIEDKLKTLG